MTNLVDKSRYDSYTWELGGKVLDAFGTSNEVKEEDMLLGHSTSLENLNSHGCRAA